MVIKMKLNFTAVGFVLLFTSFAVLASPTSGPAQAQQRAILDRVKTEAERLASEGRSATARYDSPDASFLKIYSLKDFPASEAVKSIVAAGAARGGGVQTVAAGKIPSTAAVIAELSPVRRSNSELERNLSYAPADLSKTPLAAAELLSTEPTGTIGGADSTGVARFFRVPNWGVVQFSEDDYLASKTRIKLIRETLNVDVNGTPARSYSVRSEDGKGLAELRWVTPTRSYGLTLISDDGSRIEAAEMMLMQIAKGIAQ